ncbi:glycosyltransferase [Limnoglobus roseus]|uniref:glycosyltransferase n=1 Tax=Limnoglobus roseus TaxID=2598579 RepID=UPI0011EAD572|nr:glycosyltransferase [Limnoglobus roseus]
MLFYMLITVAICTWNRSLLLDRTLTHLHRQRIPAGVEWEIVLVDNNCTDDTAAVAEKHAKTLPLRRVVETQQGHSHARNRAVDEARGELVLWTDDDVNASETWVAEYARIAQFYPDAGYFGGRVTPWFADEIPAATRAMIEANLPLLAPVYSLKDYGTEIRPFAPGEGPFGANMGYRTDVLRRFRFDPKFGRVKTGLIGADEVSVVRAVQNAGIPGVWIGSTEIQHYIPPDRTTVVHFWRYFEALGRTQVRLEGVTPAPTLLGRPRWAVLGSWKARVRAWLGRQANRPDWLAHYLTAAKLAGYADEASRIGSPPYR